MNKDKRPDRDIFHYSLIKCACGTGEPIGVKIFIVWPVVNIFGRGMFVIGDETRSRHRFEADNSLF
jgi:hypothetical protein